jgi:hypothetical protein
VHSISLNLVIIFINMELRFLPLRAQMHTALKNATMLTFAFAAGGAKDLDQESLGYQSTAITSLRTKIASINVPATEMMPTIGAILLLAGVEVGNLTMTRLWSTCG